MKKIFSLFAAVLFVGSMMAEGLLFEQTYPGDPSKFTNNYTSSFTLTTDGYTLEYASFNNGQSSNNWDAIRAGRNGNASVATITSEAVASKVSKVVIDFTQVNAGLTNELYLLVADDANFTGATKIAQTITVGEVAFEVSAPAENKFYRVVLDMAAGTANGFNRIDKVQFITPEGGTPIVPPTYDTLTVAEAITKAEALADNATTTEKYYIVGYAVNVAAYNTLYGNQNFNLADDVNAPDSVFEAYAAYPSKDGKVYPVLEGDKVLAFGAIKKYVGAYTQLEMANPIVEFLEEVEGDRTIEETVVKYDTVTVAEAIDIAKALTPEKGKSQTTSKTYAVRGFIVGTSTKTEKTWYMADEVGAYGEFEVYKCASIDKDVAEGDYVIVTGKIQHYYGEGNNGEYHTYEISNGALVHAEAPQGIENLILTEKAQKVVVDGVVYIVRDNKLFNLQGAQVR